MWWNICLWPRGRSLYYGTVPLRVCSHPCCKTAFSAPKSAFSTLRLSERQMQTWGMHSPSLVSLCHFSGGTLRTCIRVLGSPPRATRCVSSFYVDIHLRAEELHLIWVQKNILKNRWRKMKFPTSYQAGSCVNPNEFCAMKVQGWMWGCVVPQPRTARAVTDLQRFSLS